jgi:hypothetical protein
VIAPAESVAEIVGADVVVVARNFKSDAFPVGTDLVKSAGVVIHTRSVVFKFNDRTSAGCRYADRTLARLAYRVVTAHSC